MAEVSVLDRYLSLDESFHFTGYQVEPSDHWDQEEKLFLQLYFLFFDQDLSQFFGFTFPLVDLEVSLVDDVLIIALYDFGLDFFLNFLLFSLLLGHLIFLLLFLVFLERNVSAVFALFFLGHRHQ